MNSIETISANDTKHSESSVILVSATIFDTRSVIILVAVTLCVVMLCVIVPVAGILSVVMLCVIVPVAGILSVVMLSVALLRILVNFLLPFW